jgi:ribonuclease P protein component
VRSTGVDARRQGVRITAAPNGLDLCRVGYTTPGLGSAVNRNRVRRRLREAIRPLPDAAAGVDLIVSAGAPALDMPFASLRAAVAAATGEALSRLHRRGDRPRAQNEPNDHLAPASTRREPIPG